MVEEQFFKFDLSYQNRIFSATENFNINEINKLKIHSQRTLIWTRHPFDKNMIKVANELNLELVSVGKNQYLSNYLLTGLSDYFMFIFETVASIR